METKVEFNISGYAFLDRLQANCCKKPHEARFEHGEKQGKVCITKGNDSSDLILSHFPIVNRGNVDGGNTRN